MRNFIYGDLFIQY